MILTQAYETSLGGVFPVIQDNIFNHSFVYLIWLTHDLLWVNDHDRHWENRVSATLYVVQEAGRTTPSYKTSWQIFTDLCSKWCESTERNNWPYLGIQREFHSLCMCGEVMFEMCDKIFSKWANEVALVKEKCKL